MTRPVLYFGSYDAGPGRNTILQEALRAADIRFIEHRVQVWRDTDEKLAAATPIGALRAVAKQGRAWFRVSRGLPSEAAVVIVGSTAHLDLPIARRVANRLRCPLFFDPLVSATETLRDRSGSVTPALGLTAVGRAAVALERRLFQLADVVLADTAVHARAWESELGLHAGRCRVVPAGALATYTTVPRYEPNDGPLRVAYFGQYIPLHGVPTILEAADLLRDAPIEFLMVGRGQTLDAALRIAGEMSLPNVHFDQTWRTPARLAAEVLSSTDVCLGAFSPTPKAQRVVPFKVYAAMAAGRPIVSGDTPAVRELLRAGLELAVVPAGDGTALARTLRRLATSPEERVRLANASRTAYDARFSGLVLGRRLGKVFLEAVATRQLGPEAAIPASATAS